VKGKFERSNMYENPCLINSLAGVGGGGEGF
jgi:hypothetical protein